MSRPEKGRVRVIVSGAAERAAQRREHQVRVERRSVRADDLDGR